MGFKVRKDEPVGVRVYIPSSELGAILTDELRRSMADQYPEVELIAKPINQQDWEVAWRDFFGVVDYGGRVLIVPSWIEHEPEPHQLVIKLDPGQAFGTGHHETTRMCLGALEQLVTADCRVLDVGTGSGVLAIAAVLLGAGSVTGIDIDRVAVDVARENCTVNGVIERVGLAAGTLDASHAGRYDLVVSNISTDANIGLAAAFGSVVAPGGQLVLSGILGRDAQQVVGAMVAVGFELVALRYDADWCLIHLLRPE
jgi:ribosomal protein L11 methyltransferase